MKKTNNVIAFLCTIFGYTFIIAFVGLLAVTSDINNTASGYYGEWWMWVISIIVFTELIYVLCMREEIKPNTDDCIYTKIFALAISTYLVFLSMLLIKFFIFFIPEICGDISKNRIECSQGIVFIAVVWVGVYLYMKTNVWIGKKVSKKTKKRGKKK